MNKVWEWIKTHPLIVALILGALVLLYLLFSSSSSSSDGGTVAGYTGPSDAAVQAGAQLTADQLAAGVQANQTSAALAANTNNNATSVAIARIGAQSTNYQTEQAANVQELGINATKAVNLAGIKQQGVATAEGYQTQQIIALANDATEAQITSLNDYTTQVGYKQQTKALLGVENANTTIALANDNAQVAIASGNDKAQEHASDNELFGGIAGILGAIL